MCYKNNRNSCYKMKTEVNYSTTRLVLLESGLGLESGLESIFAGLGLSDSDLNWKDLDSDLAVFSASPSSSPLYKVHPWRGCSVMGVLYYCTLQLAIQSL